MVNDNNSSPDIDAIYEKMYDEKLRYTDGLIDEIIDFTAENGVLSETDVKDLAIYTLYTIVVLCNNQVAAPYVKKSFCEMIGDETETINYLFESLGGISATDDDIADKLMKLLYFNDGGAANGEC